MSLARRLGGPGIRRSIRGARARVQAPPTLADIATLAHWYAGDDVITAGDPAAIATHVDKVGASGLTQASAALRPAYSTSIATLGGHPGGVYTAANTHYIRATISAISQPFTVSVAWSHSALGADQAIVGGSIAGRWFVRASSTNAIEFYGGGVSVLTTSVTAVPNTSYRGIFVINGASSKARINGVSVYSGSANTGASACGDVSIGREAAATFLSGAVADVAVFSGDLIADAAALAIAEEYLGRYA